MSQDGLSRSLTQLPTEIRLKIYEHYFYDACLIDKHYLDLSLSEYEKLDFSLHMWPQDMTERLRRPNISLLQTCRLIYEETKPIFWKNFRLCLSLEEICLTSSEDRWNRPSWKGVARIRPLVQKIVIYVKGMPERRLRVSWYHTIINDFAKDLTHFTSLKTCTLAQFNVHTHDEICYTAPVGSNNLGAYLPFEEQYERASKARQIEICKEIRHQLQSPFNDCDHVEISKPFSGSSLCRQSRNLLSALVRGRRYPGGRYQASPYGRIDRSKCPGLKFDIKLKEATLVSARCDDRRFGMLPCWPLVVFETDIVDEDNNNEFKIRNTKLLTRQWKEDLCPRLCEEMWEDIQAWHHKLTLE